MWKSGTKKASEDAINSVSDRIVVAQNDENVKTKTSLDQEKVESQVLKLFIIGNEPVLNRDRHVSFLKKSLTKIPIVYECLDCSRPWLCYWSLLALEILGERLSDEENSNIVQFLMKCQDPEGGFGGGPGQYPHLASTYAAVCTLSIIGSDEAYNAINRQGLYNFLKRIKEPDNSFAMHRDGESDIRGVYCALTVAKLTNIEITKLFSGTDDWMAQCQTWEGGFGGSPGMEAHGGYTFCGLASLILLGKREKFDLPLLLRWLVNKQMRFEGGFQGRTNKLVDGCYSFWQGASFPLIHAILASEGKSPSKDHWLFDQQALQEYLLICCQDPCGGMLDKPGKNRDVYHTCYTLSGLSIAQNSPKSFVVGQRQVNSVETIHPLYNLPPLAVSNATNYFNKLPLPD